MMPITWKKKILWIVMAIGVISAPAAVIYSYFYPKENCQLIPKTAKEIMQCHNLCNEDCERVCDAPNRVCEPLAK